MDRSNVSKLDLIIRKLYLLEKKVERIHKEVFLTRVQKLKTIEEEMEKEKYEELNGRVKP